MADSFPPESDRLCSWVMALRKRFSNSSTTRSRSAVNVPSSATDSVAAAVSTCSHAARATLPRSTASVSPTSANGSARRWRMRTLSRIAWAVASETYSITPSVDMLPAVSTVTLAVPKRRGSSRCSTAMFWIFSIGMLRFCRVKTPLWITSSLSVIQKRKRVYCRTMSGIVKRPKSTTVPMVKTALRSGDVKSGSIRMTRPGRLITKRCSSVIGCRRCG